MKKINIVLKAEGNMEWNFPQGETVPRRAIYNLIGQLEYSKTILLQMLHIPEEKK